MSNNKTTNQQPAGTSMAMSLEPSTSTNDQQPEGKASRLRGGGAGKDCFLALFGCFLCFECCEGCCDIIGDIICCPCELLC